MDRYNAIPLADRGFVSTDPVTNPVRWYVEDSQDDKLVAGPYQTMCVADIVAARYNVVAARHNGGN
jgi:hypothetical protein